MSDNVLKFLFRPVANDNGSVLVISLLILVILTIVGISSTNTSIVELQIATNDQLSKIAFYNADSGIFGTPKLISHAINTSGESLVGAVTDSVATGVTYLPASGYINGSFYGQIAGFDPYDGGTNDLTFANGGINVQIDVQRTGQKNVVGGGAEFATGSEGIGSGSIAGVSIFYALDSAGTGPRNSAANIVADYRKVIGVPGGL
jgi:hypothetical protein